MERAVGVARGRRRWSLQWLDRRARRVRGRHEGLPRGCTQSCCGFLFQCIPPQANEIFANIRSYERRPMLAHRDYEVCIEGRRARVRKPSRLSRWAETRTSVGCTTFLEGCLVMTSLSQQGREPPWLGRRLGRAMVWVAAPRAARLVDIITCTVASLVGEFGRA
jgi:hypothetical protein